MLEAKNHEPLKVDVKKKDLIKRKSFITRVPSVITKRL